MKYLTKLKDENVDVHVKFGTDSEGRIDKIFYQRPGAYEHWSNGGAKVISFDSTHGTVSWGMKLCFFTTLDKFHNNKVLAVALVRNEYVASFAWCFEEFRIAFKKVDPKVMFTDGDVGMRSAIRRVFPNTKHLLCTFHLMQNMDTYLPTLFAKRKGVAIEEINRKKNQFKNLFHNIMNVHGDKRFVEAWPNTWKQLIDLIPIADFQKKYEWKRTRRGSVEIKEDTGGGFDGEVEEVLNEKQLDTRDVIEIDIIITAQQELLEKSKKKDPEESALDWLFKLEEWGEQWARCYTIQNKTYQMFSTQWWIWRRRLMSGKIR